MTPTIADEPTVPLESLKRLTKDVKLAAKTLTRDEARFLVDYYYLMQNDRIRAGNQEHALAESQEPHEVVTWLRQNSAVLERNVHALLDAYSDTTVTGRWSKSVVGIGPVIAAGLLAHVDIERAAHIGHIWNFAGLNPAAVWNKGERRPWNADLKRLCWLMGESFTKTSGHKDSVYGKLYVQRKIQEVEKNARHEFADQARKSLETKSWKRDTKTKASYEKDELPAARLHLRAQRWAVKIFLAHWHAVAFYERYKVHAPKAYVFAILGHGDEIQVPGWPF